MPASLTSTSIHLQVSAIRTRVFTAANNRQTSTRRPPEPLHSERPAPAGSDVHHRAEPGIHGASLWAGLGVRE